MKRFFLVLLSVALGTALIGCSGKKEQAQEPKEAASAPAEVAPEKPVEKVAAAPAPVKTEAVKEDAPQAVKAPAVVEKAKAAEKAVEVKAVAAVKAVEKKAVEVEKAVEKALAAAPAAGDAVAGGNIYKMKCAPCHGGEGKGTTMAPALKGSEWVKTASVGDITGVIKNGRQANEKKYPKFFSPMPASKTMSDDDLGALAAYLKSLN